MSGPWARNVRPRGPEFALPAGDAAAAAPWLTGYPADATWCRSDPRVHLNRRYSWALEVARERQQANIINARMDIEWTCNCSAEYKLFIVAEPQVEQMRREEPQNHPVIEVVAHLGQQETIRVPGV